MSNLGHFYNGLTKCRFYQTYQISTYCALHLKGKLEKADLIWSLLRHKELEHAEECPKYIISDGVRSGCDFTETSLPDFTDINLCVNGSSFDGPLKPTFISLQTQNQGTCMFLLWSNSTLHTEGIMSITFMFLFHVCSHYLH